MNTADLRGASQQGLRLVAQGAPEKNLDQIPGTLTDSHRSHEPTEASGVYYSHCGCIPGIYTLRPPNGHELPTLRRIK